MSSHKKRRELNRATAEHTHARIRAELAQGIVNFENLMEHAMGVRIKELERDLLNLVCRIHRDGGHYIAKYGEAKAIADADTVAAQNNADLDTLRADNAELVAALEDNWNCNPCETTRQQKAFDVAQSVLAKVRKP